MCLLSSAECQSHGRIRLTERNTVYYNNGTSGTTGNVEFCTSGRWQGICHNNLNDSDAYLFCRQFGYNSEFRFSCLLVVLKFILPPSIPPSLLPFLPLSFPPFLPPSFPSPSSLPLSPFLPHLDGSFIFSNPGGDSSASSYVNINCPRYYDYSPSSCSVSGTSFPMCSNTTDVATLYCYDGKNDVCVSLGYNCV